MSEPPPPADYVAIESAAELTGISARTLRYWVKTGKLAAVAGKPGKRVSLEELRRVAAVAGKEVGNPAAAAGNAELLATDPTGNGADGSAVGSTALVSDTARQQLAMLRDEWLQPLIDRVATLEHQAGRLEAERDQAQRQAETACRQLADMQARAEVAERERDCLAAQLAAGTPPMANGHTPDVTTPQPQPPPPAPRPWWQFWSR